MSDRDRIRHALAVSRLLDRVATGAKVHIYSMEYLPDGPYTCHVWVGGALTALLGDPPDGMSVEDAWEACVHPADRAHYDAAVSRQQAGEDTEIQYRMIGFDGRERWILERCRPRRARDGRVLVDGIATDITDQKRLEHELRAARDQLAHLAHHDLLTGLPNRLRLTEHLAQAIADATARGRSFALLFLDLNGFKALNDRHGHLAGDAVLTELGRRLAARLAAALVARMGGDEFVVVTPLVDGADAAAAAARASAEISAAVEPPFVLDDDGRLVAVSAAVGGAIWPVDGITAEALLRAADARMYAGKTRRAAA